MIFWLFGMEIERSQKIDIVGAGSVERPLRIPAWLREEEAELLIVGRGHAMESFSRAWSHLYTIIRESSCPVLSV